MGIFRRRRRTKRSRSIWSAIADALDAASSNDGGSDGGGDGGGGGGGGD
ncbi:hypothetical protein [Virgisporangium aliadipatigenens]|nr:hypothetical protein [Virgisporangium aliadipatigenens]